MSKNVYCCVCIGMAQSTLNAVTITYQTIDLDTGIPGPVVVDPVPVKGLVAAYEAHPGATVTALGDPLPVLAVTTMGGDQTCERHLGFLG